MTESSLRGSGWISVTPAREGCHNKSKKEAQTVREQRLQQFGLPKFPESSANEEKLSQSRRSEMNSLSERLKSQ